MSISNVLVQQVYVADGNVTTFAIPFAFMEGDAETVTKVYLVDTTTGEKTLQTLVTDYTLPHDVDTEPANVEFVSAPDDCDVLVTRVLELSQAISFLNSGQMLLDNIEDGMDILTQLLQQINEIALKSMRIHEIEGVADFNPVFPPTLGGVISSCPITNEDGDGWAETDLWPTADEIENAQAYALAALASQVAAAASAVDAQASEDAAYLSEVAAAGSALAASLSAAAALASEIAAAASAASISGFSNAAYNVTDGQAATNLTGETIDGLLYTSGYYLFEIIRGTTVVAQGELSLHFKNSVWEIVLGGYRGDVHGVTFTVTQAVNTVQLLAALDSGAGNGTIKFKRAFFAV